MASTRLYIIGGGGHAKVVITLLRDLGHQIVSVFDDDPIRWGAELLGIPVAGPVERLIELPRLPTIIAIGDNAARRGVAERLDLPWFTAVHPHAHVDRTVQLAEGSVVMAGAVVQVDAKLGRHTIVNTRASIDHDCVVGDFVHIAPGATLAGNVHVESNALIGAGAVAIPSVRIGRGSTIGAGAVIVRDVPSDTTVKGVPAR